MSVVSIIIHENYLENHPDFALSLFEDDQADFIPSSIPYFQYYLGQATTADGTENDGSVPEHRLGALSYEVKSSGI